MSYFRRIPNDNVLIFGGDLNTHIDKEKNDIYVRRQIEMSNILHSFLSGISLYASTLISKKWRESYELTPIQITQKDQRLDYIFIYKK